eukprot:UN23122
MDWLYDTDMPKLHIYDDPGALNPPELVSMFQSTMSNYETFYVGYGAHFFQEDHPEKIGRAIVDWYRRMIQQRATDVCEDVDCNEEARRYCYDDYLVSSDGYGMCKEDDSDEGYHCEMSEDRREHCDYGCDEEERRCMDHESEDSSSSDSMECEWMDLGMGMCRGPHGEAAPNFSADGFTQEKCMHACEETDGCFGVSLSRGGRCAMWMKEMPDYEHK